MSRLHDILEELDEYADLHCDEGGEALSGFISFAKYSGINEQKLLELAEEVLADAKEHQDIIECIICGKEFPEIQSKYFDETSVCSQKCYEKSQTFKYLPNFELFRTGFRYYIKKDGRAISLNEVNFLDEVKIKDTEKVTRIG